MPGEGVGLAAVDVKFALGESVRACHQCVDELEPPYRIIASANAKPMTIQAFDHVNVRTARLAEMVAFYESMLGLRVGDRPPFAFAGAWLYCGSQAVVHLVQVAQPPKGEEPLLEHIAFRGTGLAAFLALLRSRRVAYRIGIVPGWNVRQVNFFDPDGNRLHVDFAADEIADLSDYDGA